MEENIMDNTIDISIIIPVFNVEDYIERCLDSIFEQKFSGKFEVIAVDDASQDKSLEKLYQYAKKERNLKILSHRINRKLSIARTTGMLHSRGNLIMHVDSDDWIIPGALENLHRTFINTKADVIVFNYIHQDSSGNKTKINLIKNNTVTTNKEIVHKYFLGAPWNKIIRRELISDMIYQEVGINNGEDLVWSTEILLRAKVICTIPEYYYTYFVNTQSLTRKSNPTSFLEAMTLVVSQLEKVISIHNPPTSFIQYILKYFLKFVFAENLRMLLERNNQNFETKKNLILKIASSNLVDKRNKKRISLALQNRIYCIYQTIKFLGLRPTLSLLLKRR